MRSSHALFTLNAGPGPTLISSPGRPERGRFSAERGCAGPAGPMFMQNCLTTFNSRATWTDDARVQAGAGLATAREPDGQIAAGPGVL